MTFCVDTADSLSVSDKEILDLLMSVYVNEGYTSPDNGRRIFDPSSVKKRGNIFAARSNSDDAFAGMIILVPPDSPAKVFAMSNEAEIHLLAVDSKYRNFGLGKQLLEKALQEAQIAGYQRILLWTQPSMVAAQNLYESLGFSHNKERDFEKADRKFHFYVKNLVK